MKCMIYGQLSQLGEVLADRYQTVISSLCSKLKEKPYLEIHPGVLEDGGDGVGHQSAPTINTRKRTTSSLKTSFSKNVLRFDELDSFGVFEGRIIIETNKSEMSEPVLEIW